MLLHNNCDDGICVLAMVYREFYVWTFAYDISGIASVTFYYRKDMDGINPIEDTANEVYHSGVSH